MQNNPPQTSENWQATGKPASHKSTTTILSKNSIAYWKQRVYQPQSRTGTCANYSVRISRKGKRIYFALETPDKETAARKAVTIYRHAVEHGWEETLSKYRPGTSLVTSETQCQQKGYTVGDLIRHVQGISTARPQTLTTYVRALRRIVSEIESLSIPKRYYGSNHEIWVSSVDRIPLEAITPDRVLSWRKIYIQEHSGDAAAKKRATVTVNSLIRNAKALFSKKLLPHLAKVMTLPTELPFENISQLNAGSTRYQSKIRAKDILDAAEIQLRSKHPNAYMILQLALRCGLRVSEIDHLLWTSIDLDSAKLYVQNTQYHQLKSEDSEGDIDLSEHTVARLRKFQQQAHSEFVIDVSEPPTHQDSNRRYRCRKPLNYLRAWLKMKGVCARKPIHELRKEVGSLIASEHGIYEASRFLRHSNIQITANYYLDKRNKILPTF